MQDNLYFNLKDLKYIGANVIIGKTVRIRQPELVSIGDNTIVDDFTYISGEVNIGNYVHIASSCTLQASKSKIIIEDFCGISTGVRIFGTSTDYLFCSVDLPTVPQNLHFGSVTLPVTLGKFSLIGANTVVLPGVTTPEGFACAALLKITPKLELKKWHLMLDENTIIKRHAVNKYKTRLLEIDKY